MAHSHESDVRDVIGGAMAALEQVSTFFFFSRTFFKIDGKPFYVGKLDPTTITHILVYNSAYTCIYWRSTILQRT